MSALALTLLALALEAAALVALVAVPGRETLLPGLARLRHRRLAIVPPIAAAGLAARAVRSSLKLGGGTCRGPAAALSPAFLQAPAVDHERDCKEVAEAWRGVLFPERRRNER